MSILLSGGLSSPSLRRLKLPQFLPGFSVQILRYLNLHAYILVTVHLWILHGHNALSPKPYFRPRLRSFPDLAEYVSIKSLNHHFPAEYCGRKRDVSRRINILPLSLKACLPADLYF